MAGGQDRDTGKGHRRLLGLLSKHEEFMDIIYSTIWVPRLLVDGILDTPEVQRLRNTNLFPPHRKIAIAEKYPSLIVTLLEYSLGLSHLVIEYVNKVLTRNPSRLTARDSSEYIEVVTAITQLSAAIVFRTLTLMATQGGNDKAVSDLSRLVYCILNVDLIAFDDTAGCDWDRFLLDKHRALLEHGRDGVTLKVDKLFPGFSGDKELKEAINNLWEKIKNFTITINKLDSHGHINRLAYEMNGAEFVYLVTQAALTPDVLSPLFVEIMLRIISTAGLRRIDPAKIVYTLTEYIDVYLRERDAGREIMFYLNVPSLAVAERFLETYMSYLASYYTGFYDEPSALEYTAELLEREKKHVAYIVSHIETSRLTPDELRVHVSEYLNTRVQEEWRETAMPRSYNIFNTVDECILDAFIAHALSSTLPRRGREKAEDVSVLNRLVGLLEYYVYQYIVKKTIATYSEKTKGRGRGGSSRIVAGVRHKIAYRTPTLIAYRTYRPNRGIDSVLSYLEECCRKIVIDYKIGVLTWADIIKDLISQSLPMLVVKLEFSDEASEASRNIAKQFIKEEIIRLIEEME